MKSEIDQRREGTRKVGSQRLVQEREKRENSRDKQSRNGRNSSTEKNKPNRSTKSSKGEVRKKAQVTWFCGTDGAWRDSEFHSRKL